MGIGLGRRRPAVDQPPVSPGRTPAGRLPRHGLLACPALASRRQFQLRRLSTKVVTPGRDKMSGVRVARSRPGVTILRVTAARCRIAVISAGS
jgi:hypothetical protein